MSEELLHEETQNEGTPVTMADLEEHFDDANPWNVVKSYMEKGTVLPVKVEGIVNGGAIAMVEGLRGFIPASCSKHCFAASASIFRPLENVTLS